MMPESEQQFMGVILELASVCGWSRYHTFDSRRSELGFPDLCLIRPPSVIFVEVKTTIGRLSLAQQQWIDKLQRCPGVEVYIWRPEHWSEIVERLT